MSTHNTDPLAPPTAADHDTDPSAAPVTMIDVEAQTTSDLSPLSSPHAPRGSSGTQPGLGRASPALDAADTVIDSTDPGKPGEAVDTVEEARGTDERLAIALQLGRLGGRAPQLASLQAESAGRAAASYAAVVEPVKSNATSRTDPFGVIVTPDSLPPAQVKRGMTEPMLAVAPSAPVQAAPTAPIVVAPMAPVPVGPVVLAAAGVEASSLDRATPAARMTTVPGRRARSGSPLVYGALLVTALAVGMIGFLVVGRPPSPASTPARSATAPTQAQASAAIMPATPATPASGRSSVPVPTAETSASTAPSGASSATAPFAPTSSSQPRGLMPGTNAPPTSMTRPREIPSARAIDSGSQTPPHPTSLPPRLDDTKRTYE